MIRDPPHQAGFLLIYIRRILKRWRETFVWADNDRTRENGFKLRGEI